MDPHRKLWNERHQKQTRALAAGERDTAIALFLDQHAMVHSAKATRSALWSFEDELLDGLSEQEMRQIPAGGEHSIAWILLHLARIEDIVMNKLVAGQPQLFHGRGVGGEAEHLAPALRQHEPKPGKFPNRPPRRSILFCDFNVMSSSMGISAGGKMKQEIYPDPHGFDTWDPENFGRLFVHIVNSEMYREITGMAPPPTPISAKAYADCGLPWFDLYGSDLGDLPPAKEFAKVKTIKGIDEGKDLEGAQDDDPVDVPRRKPL